MDEPVGAGFSYAKTSEGYNISDTLAVAQLYDFLRKVIEPKLFNNNTHLIWHLRSILLHKLKAS